MAAERRLADDRNVAAQPTHVMDKWARRQGPAARKLLDSPRIPSALP